MTTIDYGIDLGTTNSSIAVLAGVETEMVKNNDDEQTTASAVWIDRRERLFVGRTARERAESDPDNTCLEFKLRMGTAGSAKRFAATVTQEGVPDAGECWLTTYREFARAFRLAAKGGALRFC